MRLHFVPVLEPHLHDSHVETRLRAELFSYMSRRFRTLVVGSLEWLELLGRDRRPRSLVGGVYVEVWTQTSKVVNIRPLNK